MHYIMNVNHVNLSIICWRHPGHAKCGKAILKIHPKCWKGNLCSNLEEQSEEGSKNGDSEEIPM